jgi:tetratricopeptide (TPR) repeat protein
MKNYDDAIVDLSKAIELNPEFSEAFTNRGLAKYNLKNYEEAIKDLDSSIELNPNSAIAYLNRGYAKLDGKKEGACDDFYKALDLGYEDVSDIIKKHCE